MALADLVERAHGGRGRRDHVVDEEEKCVLGPQAYPLSDEEVELADSQVGGDQVLLLIQVTDPGRIGIRGIQGSRRKDQ
jgi:hypothetical protein